MSQASTATAGALATLALFASCTCCANRPRAPSSRTYSTLSGCVFAVVGPHLARSQIAASSASLTGVGANVPAVRASVNKTARPWSPKGLSDGAGRLTVSVTPCLLSDGIRADRSLGPGGRRRSRGATRYGVVLGRRPGHPRRATDSGGAGSCQSASNPLANPESFISVGEFGGVAQQVWASEFHRGCGRPAHEQEMEVLPLLAEPHQVDALRRGLGLRGDRAVAHQWPEGSRFLVRQAPQPLVAVPVSDDHEPSRDVRPQGDGPQLVRVDDRAVGPVHAHVADSAAGDRGFSAHRWPTHRRWG